jgi:antitoxin VapB
VDSEIQTKIDRMQKMLADEKLDGVLINSQHNFAWLTGGKSNGINLSSEMGACFLLIRRDGKCFVLANNIEMPRLLTEEIAVADFEPVEFAWQDEKASGNFVFEKAASLLSGDRVLAMDLALNDLIRPVENLIARCRYQLTDNEIERYRKLGKEAGEAIGEVIGNIQPGDAEIEIARKTGEAFAVRNINPVVTLVGADKRIERFRHPIPTKSIWKKLLLIAVCARREGLIANLSRLVCVGKVSDELKEKTEATAYVFAKLLSETKSGVNGAQLYNFAAASYKEKGFSNEINLHHQGGATGYKTRDWVVHPKSNETVFPNQAFAWNPSITGTKTEETALIFNDCPEIITATPSFPQISVRIDGCEYLSPDVLSL